MCWLCQESEQAQCELLHVTCPPPAELAERFEAGLQLTILKYFQTQIAAYYCQFNVRPYKWKIHTLDYTKYNKAPNVRNPMENIWLLLIVSPSQSTFNVLDVPLMSIGFWMTCSALRDTQEKWACHENCLNSNNSWVWVRKNLV
jgi:hypothetical protein